MAVFKRLNNKKIFKKLFISLGLSAILLPTSTIFLKNNNRNGLQKKLFNDSNLFASKNLKSVDKVVNASEIFNLQKESTSINNLEFDEIIIAPKNNPSDVFISFKNVNNNLELSFKKSNEELKEKSNLSADAPINSENLDKFVGNNYIFLQSVKTNDFANTNNPKVETNTLIDTTINKIIKFNKLGSSSYFSIDTNDNNKMFNVDNGTNFLFRGYIDSSKSNNSGLTIFVKAGNKIFSPDSSDKDKESINYNFFNQSTSFETIIGLNENNKLAISYDADLSQNTSNVSINKKSNSIDDFLQFKAQDALNKITIGQANNDSSSTTWGDILIAQWRNYTALQFALTKVKFIGSNVDGTIVIKVYLPYVIERTSNGRNCSLNFKDGSTAQLKITGFNKGSMLINDKIDASILSEYLPQKILKNDDLKNTLKKIVYEQCFGEDNLLDQFNYKIDLEFTNPLFNNLTGEINCNLIVLNNYIDINGQPVTNNTRKDFGKINISKLNDIDSTNQKGSFINIPSGSNLANVNSFNANQYIGDLKLLVYNNVDDLLNNIPSDKVADRNINITDIDFDANNIIETKSNQIKLDKIKIKYYFNDINGSYDNENPFELREITIKGFKETQKTILKKNSFEVSNQINVETEKYTQTAAQFFLEEKYRNGELFNIVYDDFNIKNDILINDWNPNPRNGEISFVLQAKNVFDDNGPVRNFIDIGTITLTGFKKVVPTILSRNIYQVSEQYKNLEVEKITIAQIKTIITSIFNENQLFNSVSTNFNINTDIEYNEKYILRNNQNGSIDIQIYAKNIYEQNLSIAQNYKNLGKITLTGFKKISKTILLNNKYDVSKSYSNVFTNNITLKNIEDIILNIYNENQLFNSVSTNFNPNNDIKINGQTITKDEVNGIINVDIFAKNIYNDNFEITNKFNKVGNLTLTGFRKRVSTLINNNKTFDISKISEFKELYVTDVSDDPNSIGYINRIIESFSSDIFKPNALFENLPNDFDYTKNININILHPDNLESKMDVEFKINYYLNNGEPITDIAQSVKLTIIGFKELPSTTINGKKIDLNKTKEIYIECPNKVQSIPFDIITTSLKGNLNLITNKDNSFWWSPLINIIQPNLSNNRNNQKNIIFDFSNAQVELSNQNIILSNVHISGFYCYFDNKWTEINNNNNNLYKITIYGFGKEPKKNTLPIWVIIVISVITVNLALLVTWICYRYYKKSIKNRSKGDKFDDIDKSSSNLSF